MSASQPADPRSALILDGHTGAAVEALQALARAGVQVDVAGPENSLGFESRYLRHALQQPEPDDEFVAWLRDLDERFGYDLILPASGNALYSFLELADGDPLRAKAALPSRHALGVAHNKGRVQSLARGLGIRTIPSTLIEWLDDVPPAGHFPVVLTPAEPIVSSAGRLRSFEPVLARNEEQRMAQLSYLVRHVPVLQHAFVPGQSWGITMVYAHGVR